LPDKIERSFSGNIGDLQKKTKIAAVPTNGTPSAGTGGWGDTRWEHWVPRRKLRVRHPEPNPTVFGLTLVLDLSD
jgi:hypothetical protein